MAADVPRRTGDGATLFKLRFTGVAAPCSLAEVVASKCVVSRP